MPRFLKIRCPFRGCPSDSGFFRNQLGTPARPPNRGRGEAPVAPPYGALQGDFRYLPVVTASG
jgi:hypothetical protein